MITHDSNHPDEDDSTVTNSMNTVFNMVDDILSKDDFNQDGYIDYNEYSKGLSGNP